MADAKISALTSATAPLAGTETVPIVQSSTTKKATVADLLNQPTQAATLQRVRIGGATASYPSLVNSGSTLKLELADGSGRATLETSTVFGYGYVAAYVGAAIPHGGSDGAGFRLSSTENFGVFFGSGVPTLRAAKGSLYLRSDGSGVADRMYVNTDGSTTWTAVVTAT